MNPEDLLARWTPPEPTAAFRDRFAEALVARTVMERGFVSMSAGEPDADAFARKLEAAIVIEAGFRRIRGLRVRRLWRVAAVFAAAALVVYLLLPKPPLVVPPAPVAIKPRPRPVVNYHAMWQRDRCDATLLALRDLRQGAELLRVARAHPEFRAHALDLLATMKGVEDLVYGALETPSLRPHMLAGIRERGSADAVAAARRAIHEPAPLGLEAMRLCADLGDREALASIRGVVNHCLDRRAFAEAMPVDASVTPAAMLPGAVCSARIREGIAAMASIGDRSVIPDLIRLASLSTWREPALAALRQVSGVDCGTDARKWRQWWNSQGT